MPSFMYFLHFLLSLNTVNGMSMAYNFVTSSKNSIYKAHMAEMEHKGGNYTEDALLSYNG